MTCEEILPGGRRPDRAARSLAALGRIPTLQIQQRLGAAVESAPTVPANAIYIDGYPVPDPSGTGYLTFGALV